MKWRTLKKFFFGLEIIGLSLLPPYLSWIWDVSHNVFLDIWTAKRPAKKKSKINRTLCGLGLEKKGNKGNMNICTPQTAKAGKKKKFFLQESRTKGFSKKQAWSSVSQRKRGLIERPACFQEHIKIKRKKKKARKKEKEEVKAKNENPPTQMLRV